MSLRPLQVPQDFRRISAMVSRLSTDTEWDLPHDDIRDLVGMFWLLRQTWDFMAPVRWFIPMLRDTLLGFVWEIENEIVGMAIYDRMWGSDTWRLTFLAVLPTYRRRGIAARLVDAVVNAVRDRNGSRILLEVEGQSTSAKQLFERMGFMVYAGEIEYEYSLPEAPPLAALPEGYQQIPISYYADEPRYKLAKRIIPPRTQHFEQVTRSSFYRNNLWWGMRWLSLRARGTTETEFIIQTDPEGDIVALGGYAIRNQWGAISEIAIRVDERHPLLIPYLFHTLVYDAQHLSRRRRVEMIVPVWQTALRHYAEANGFFRLSEYYKMGIILREDVRTISYPSSRSLSRGRRP